MYKDLFKKLLAEEKQNAGKPLAEAKMDPVSKSELKGKFKDRKDKDIDNDGDSDSSDEYLHKRRKAISKAIAKEESEQIDELSKKTLGSYVKKASSDMAGNAYALGARDPLKPKGSWNKDIKRGKGIAKAIDKLTKEEVEDLDEVSKKTLTNYAKASYNDVLKRRSNRPAGKGDESDPKIGKRLKMNALAHKKGAFEEEAEQIDEVSSKTLTSYMAKASDSRNQKTAAQADKRIAGQNLADKKLRKMDGYKSSAKVAATYKEEAGVSEEARGKIQAIKSPVQKMKEKLHRKISKPESVGEAVSEAKTLSKKQMMAALKGAKASKSVSLPKMGGGKDVVVRDKDGNYTTKK